MITNTRALSFFLLIYTSLASKMPPSITANKIFEKVEEGSLGLRQKLFTITARELNGGSVEVRPSGPTNDIVKINGTNNKNSVTMDVFLKYELDREAKSSYTLVFAAVSTDPSLPSSQLNVTLFVLDINDTPPKFSSMAYRIELAENHPLSNDIGVNVFATDPDNGLGGLVTYSLQAAGQASGLYGNTFGIDSSNGHIKLLQSLDYEKLTFYQYKINATDRGNPILFSTADLLIMVKDVQDTPPIFQRLPFMTTISENTTKGTSIYEIFATDGDTGIPDNITYSLTYQSNEAACDDFLQINNITGVISINQIMDRDNGTIKRLNGICVVHVTASEITNATANNNSQTTKPFTITVKDENDNPPKFTKKLYEGSVKENMTDITITIPGNIQVSDIDQNGYNEIKLTVLNRTDVVPSPDSVIQNGIVLLRLKSPLDYEKEKNVTFMIKAEDLKNSSFVNYCKVNVQINDTNDNDPVFQSRNEDLFLPENSCFNTTIATITATDMDSGEFGKIKYSLDRIGSFNIDATTGRVYVFCNESCAKGCNNTGCDTSCLDREKKDRYYLTVEAIDGGGRRTALPITLTLKDENDNRPKFRYNSYQIGLLENKKIFSNGEEDIEIQADDGDLSENKNISYKILQNTTHFHINKSTGKLSITKEVDYENLTTAANGYINLTIIAYDHGTPQQSSSVQLTIQVKDINDNSPVFMDKTYNASVCENAASGTNVTTVFASDADKTHPNNQLSYFIEKGGSDQFTINGQTGELSVQVGANLDREIQSNYTLTVIAIDKGDPQRTGTTSVLICLIDENDTPPRWLNLPNTTTVPENATEPTIFLCKGDDSDLNPTLIYSIKIKEASDSDGKPVNLSLIRGLISINSTTGVVSVNNLDAEVAVTIKLTVTVTDNSTIMNDPNATSELIIQITDENDNPPVFKNARYTSDILENARDNTSLAYITATDIDISKNHRVIRYYIDDEQCPFSINPSTGNIIKKGKLDRETKPFWIITIRASDDSKYNATAELNVTVLDFNDNTPFFINEPYIFNVTEQSYNQTQIGQLYAGDLDAGPNQKITYTITRGNAGLHFYISDVNGSLFINGDIDRENIDKYDLVVAINDNPIEKADTKLNSTRVVVNILDVNDNSPYFTSNSKQPIRVKETTKLGTVVRTLSATDKDVGKNGAVYYRVGSNGNVSVGLFVIDDYTGSISVNESIKDKAGIYTLEVLAIDKGSPPRNSSSMLDVYILDENIHSPVFTEFPHNGLFKIFECAKKGTIVTTINATDDDKDYNNHRLKYEFMYSNSSTGQHFESFSINNITGVITLIGNLDREEKSLFKISVKCTDHGEPPLSTTSPELTISVEDVNDNPPEFTTNITKVNIKENQTNIIVTEVAAVDRDSISVIQYAIKGGLFSDFFKINDSSGKIEIEKPLDRENMTNDEISLTIEATDVTKPNISSECDNIKLQNNTKVQMEVVITVLDINDNPPIFKNTQFSKGILRNTKFETVVIDLTEVVIDYDSSMENRKHKFFATNISYTGTLKIELKDKTFKTNCGEAFCVNANGTVVTNFVISDTMKGVAKLQLVANDSAGSTTTSLKIYVIGDSQVVTMHIIKTKPQVDEIKSDVLRMYSEIIGYNCVFDEMETYMKENGEPDPFTTLLKFHVVNRETDEVLEATDVVTKIDRLKGDALTDVRNKYSIQSISDLQSQRIVQSFKIKETYILIAVISLMSLILCIVIYFYIKSTQRYKTKLKAANVPTVDYKKENKQSNLPGSNVYSNMKNPLMNKDEELKRSMENLDKMDNASICGSDDSMDPSDFEYAKHNMAFDSRLEDKEVVMDMFVEDGPMAESDNPLALALSQHERQKNSRNSSNGRISEMSDQNLQYESLETTEV